MLRRNNRHKNFRSIYVLKLGPHEVKELFANDLFLFKTLAEDGFLPIQMERCENNIKYKNKSYM